MFGIDNGTAVSSMPSVSPAGVEGYFSGGDPAAGLPATVVSPDWLNIVQSELRNFVLGAGLNPSKTDFTQLLQAVKLLIGGGAGLGMSLSDPGYVTLPGGFIIQGGTATTGANGFTTIDFPIEFPKKCLLGLPLEQAGAGTWANNQPSLYSIYNGTSTSGMTVYGLRWDPSSGSPTEGTWVGASGMGFGWLAMGW